MTPQSLLNIMIKSVSSGQHGHSERSEESHLCTVEMLRCALHDRKYRSCLMIFSYCLKATGFSQFVGSPTAWHRRPLIVKYAAQSSTGGRDFLLIFHLW